VDLIASPRLPRGREVKLIAKISLAAVIAWWLSGELGAESPAFAAIIPLVALRADDPYGAIGVSLIRVLGTVIGIMVGIAVLQVDPDPGLLVVAGVIVVSLMVGLFVRGPNETVSQVVAVTALIVLLLGPGDATGYGAQRIWETLLGAAIAILVAMVLWPPDPIVGLRELIRDLATEIVGDLDRVGALPGRSLADAERLLDERVRAAMGTNDSIRILDRAHSALRWNPRHRGRRDLFWPLAVQIRQLLATSRYVRSMVWLMVAGADGVHVHGWSLGATGAFAGALGQLAVGATAVAAGSDPDASIARARSEADRFVVEARAAGEGTDLADDLHGAIGQVLRVLDASTAERLEALLRDRYATG
jgi:uncharacterized membrane protein YgaE (UPF0421/DUF939 family)